MANYRNDFVIGGSRPRLTLQSNDVRNISCTLLKENFSRASIGSPSIAEIHVPISFSERRSS